MSPVSFLQDLEAEQERRKRSKQQQQQKQQRRRRGGFSFRSAALAGGLIDIQRRLRELRAAAEAAAAGDGSSLFEEDERSRKAAAAAAERQPQEVLTDLVGVFKALLRQLEGPKPQEQQQSETDMQQEEVDEQRVLQLETLPWFEGLQTERPLRRLLWLMGLECPQGDTRWFLPKEVSAATWKDRLQVFEAMHARSLDVSKARS